MADNNNSALLEECFQRLIELIYSQQVSITELRKEIERIPGWGGGGGGGGVLIDKRITKNGIFNAVDDAADGYRSVTVDVPGGGGPETITEYETNTVYQRYQTLIDPETETVYIVTPADGTDTYRSETIENDVLHENIKLIGSDSRLVIFDHPPTQSEINQLPENVVVVEYDPNDTPYAGLILNNNNNG